MDIFSKEALNTGRQRELDIGKALPILGLPFVHCIIECCTEEQLLHGIPYAFDMIIGGPMAAPMFVFCMGATVHYSKKHSPVLMAQIGLMLLLCGFLLNICRFLIPFLIGYGITGDAEQFLTPLPFFVFGNDILQFAGLAMLAISLMMRLNLSKTAMFLLSLCFSVTGSFIRGVDLHNDVLNVILGWFVGTESEAVPIISDFPLLNWLIVPVSGYIFGWWLQRVKDKKRFYLSFSPVFLIASIIYLFIGDHFEIGMFAEGENAYYHMVTYDVIASLALTLGLLGVYSALSYILPDVIMRFFTFTSRSITPFYCIHWVFVRVITNVILYAVNGTQLLAVPYILIISLGIALATFAVILLYNRIKDLYVSKFGGAEA